MAGAPADKRPDALHKLQGGQFRIKSRLCSPCTPAWAAQSRSACLLVRHWGMCEEAPCTESSSSIISLASHLLKVKLLLMQTLDRPVRSQLVINIVSGCLDAVPIQLLPDGYQGDGLHSQVTDCFPIAWGTLLCLVLTSSDSQAYAGEPWPIHQPPEMCNKANLVS